MTPEVQERLRKAEEWAELEMEERGYLSEQCRDELELARISHRVEAHRGANQRKFFCEKDFAMIRGKPRCRQSVAQSSLRSCPSWWCSWSEAAREARPPIAP